MKFGSNGALSAHEAARKQPDLLKYAVLVLALLVAFGTLTGCQNVSGHMSPVTVALAMHGRVHGGQQPVAQSLIQLYAVGTSGMASAAQPLVTQPVYTDDAGDFDLDGLYTCPSSDAQVYVTSVGGNNSPGLTGKPNPGIALMTMLGPCGQLTDATYVSINEVTTVGSIWPLAAYMTSSTQLGSAAGDTAFQDALAKVNILVNTGSGASPGTPTPTAYFDQPAKLYSLADALASCINSTGGSAGDGSWCGNLYSYATEKDGVAPTDTITAALHIAQNPTRQVSNIFALVPPASPFEPALTVVPSDWKLDVYEVPETPVITPGTGTYLPGQPVTIAESVSSAIIHYTTDGSTPTADSPVYSAPLDLESSETVKAIAIAGSTSSSVASATLTVAAGHLVFTSVPANAIAASVLSPAPSVNVVDGSGNLLTGINPSVTLAFGANPGGGALAGTTTAIATNGTATFPGLSIANAGTDYTLTASAAGLGSTTSAPFDVTSAVLTIAVPNPTIVVGNSGTGTVTLPTPAGASGTSVTLTSSASNLVSISPATLTIAAGQTSASFTYAATSAGPAVLSASASGFSVATVNVAVTPLRSFFVANSGSDGNDGTTEATAWKTLAKLATVKFKAGDAAYMQCGSTFRESLTLNGSGTASAHISLGSYGSCTGSNLPLVTAADVLSGWTAEKVGSFTAYYAPVSAAPGIVFEDNHRLALQKSKSALTAGTSFYDGAKNRVYVRSREDADPQPHAMEASTRKINIFGYMTSFLDITGIEADKATQNSVEFGGILTNVTLTSLITNYCKQNGVYFTANTGEAQNNVLIQKGIANYNGGDGVSKGNGGNNVVVDGYVANYNAFDPNNTFSGGIRLVSDGTTDANRATYSGIRNSSTDFNGVDPDTAAQVSYTTGSGVGVWCDTCGNGSFLTNNEGHGNTQAGAELEWSGPNGSQSMTGNVEWNNFYGILHSRRAHNDLIANNSADGNYINCQFSGDGDTATGMVNNTYANNICGSHVWNSSGSIVRIINGTENNGVEGSGNVFLNNSFGDPSAATGVFMEYGAGNKLKNYDQFDAAYGSSTHSMKKDPMLMNPAVGNFHLHADSPAIGAGLWGKDLGALPFASAQ